MSKRRRAPLGGTGVFADPLPKASEGPGANRPDRDGRVPMPFWTGVAAKRQLRMLAAEQDTTQQALMAEALNLLFARHGKPPIA
jgi:Antitoxin-like ribbon-helix-helix